MCEDICAHCGPCERSALPYPARFDWHDAGHPTDAQFGRAVDRAIASENRRFLNDPAAIAEAQADGDRMRRQLDADR